jgi:hypothetical protein
MEILALRGDLEQWNDREAELSSTTATNVSGLIAGVCAFACVRVCVCARLRVRACVCACVCRSYTHAIVALLD